MRTDRDFTNLVRSWIQTDQHESADRLLGSVFDHLDTHPQRRQPWRAWRNNLMSGTFKMVWAGAAAVLVAAVALGIYLNQANVGPIGSPSFSLPPTTETATDSPPSPPAPPAVRAPFVVFTLHGGMPGVVGDELWAMRADGTGAQQLHQAPGFSNVAWSQDGTKLLLEMAEVSGASRVYLADVGDVIGPFVDTGFGTGADTACNDKSDEPAPCQDSDLTFAPDGQRVAFVRRCTHSVPGCAFINILDLRTGGLTELDATLSQGKKGLIEYLTWSPDGTHLAYIIENMPSVNQQGEDATSDLWLIGADGVNPHKVDLAVPRVKAPQWSPDGRSLALMSDLFVGDPEPASQLLVQDVYTVKADGTDLRQLTTDGRSSRPEWTPSGQIRFRIGTGSAPTMRYSLMDADGSNVAALVDLDGLVRVIAPKGLEPLPNLETAFLWQPASSWYDER